MWIGRARRLAGASVAGVSVVVGLLLVGCNKPVDRAQVAADLQKSVEDYLVQIEGPKDKHVVMHGAVKVSPRQDEGYLVAIDGLKIGTPTDGYLEVGAISYVLTPKDDKTFDASQLTIANDMPIKGADGQTAGEIKLTNKAFNGTWLRDAAMFTKLDLQLADLSFADQKHGGNMKVAAVTLNTDSADKGSDLWDQTARLTIDGTEVADNSGDHVTIKEISATSVVQGLKLMDYVTKTKALREAVANQNSTAPAPAATGNGVGGNEAGGNDVHAAAIRDFAASLPKLLVAFSSDFHLSGLSYQANDTAGSFDLGKAGFMMSMTGFDQPKATLKFGIDHDALVVRAPAAQNELVQALLPANGGLVISLNDVPTKDLSSLLGDAAVSFGHADPSAMQIQMAVLFAKLQQLLQQDGVTVKVEPSHLTSSATNVNAAGQFAIQAAAAHGAVGAIDFAVTGIDQVIALAQKQSEQDPGAAQYLAMAQALLTYATREQGGDGKAVDKFKVEVPQSGPLTVNGKPLPF